MRENGLAVQWQNISARAGSTWQYIMPVRRKGADDTVGAIRDSGAKAMALQADLLEETETQTLLPRAADALGGPIDLLINNASIFEYDTIQTATRESWDRHLESNLRAPYVLTQALAQQAPEAVEDAEGEPVAQALVVNMIDQRVRKPDAEFLDLYDCQDGALGDDPNRRTGACPASAGQRDRTGAHVDRRAPVAGPFPPPARRNRPEARCRQRRYRHGPGLFDRCKGCHGTVDLRGWRTASRVAYTGCAGPGVTLRPREFCTGHHFVTKLLPKA